MVLRITCAYETPSVNGGERAQTNAYKQRLRRQNPNWRRGWMEHRLWIDGRLSICKVQMSNEGLHPRVSPPSPSLGATGDAQSDVIFGPEHALHYSTPAT